MWVAFAKATHIFSAKILAGMHIFNDQNFNNILTNDIISFEQLGPDLLTVELNTRVDINTDSNLTLKYIGQGHKMTL